MLTLRYYTRTLSYNDGTQRKKRKLKKKKKKHESIRESRGRFSGRAHKSKRKALGFHPNRKLNDIHASTL